MIFGVSCDSLSVFLQGDGRLLPGSCIMYLGWARVMQILVNGG